MANKQKADAGAAVSPGKKDFYKGLLYIGLTTLVLLSTVYSPLKKIRNNIVSAPVEWYSDMRHRKLLPDEKLSKTLNLEGKVAEAADNLVRISSAESIGCGELINEYEIVTAHHVVDLAFSKKEPIYIQSQNYLGQKERVEIKLDSSNYQYNFTMDIGKITMDMPIRGANTIRLKGVNMEDPNCNIINVAYKDNTVYNQLGKVLFAVNGGAYFQTSINAGHGISGSPVISEKGELYGIAIQALMSDNPSDYENGPMTFTSIMNPLLKTDNPLNTPKAP